MLGCQIAEATGIEPETWLCQGQLQAAVEETYSRAGIKATPYGWSRLFDSNDVEVLPNELRAFDDTLVVGTELSPLLRHAIHSTGGIYIDSHAHPVRFMDDLFLGFMSNHDKVHSALGRNAMAERQVYRAAGLLVAFSQNQMRSQLRAPAALFTAQRRLDRSLIKNGKVVDGPSLIEQNLDVFKGYQQIAVKSHPTEYNGAIIDMLKKSFPNTGEVKSNIYVLLSDPNVESVITVSSSTGLEARYFGRKSLFLSHEPARYLWAGDDSEENSFWGIYDHFLAADFWRHSLADIMNVTAPDGDVVAPKPNRLRIVFQQFWGYDAVDCETYFTHAPTYRRLTSSHAWDIFKRFLVR